MTQSRAQGYGATRPIVNNGSEMRTFHSKQTKHARNFRRGPRRHRRQLCFGGFLTEPSYDTR
jgi:hypothetical protein